jgi:cytochrome c2
MAYNGMSDVEDRANLIAYLATFQLGQADVATSI